MAYHRTQGRPLDLKPLLAALAPLDLAPGPGGSRMSDFQQTLQIYQPLLKSRFSGVWTSCTVIALYPSQQIQQHCDQPIVGQRFHIPLQQNDGCWSFSDGDWRRLKLGFVYRMDPTKPHGAVNWGETVRLHLIVDHLERP